MCLIMNPQSRGTVTLRSSDPTAAPIIDPKFLSHPFDRRVMIEGLRETRRILSAPVFAANTVEKLGPEDDSDDAIWVSLTSSGFGFQALSRFYKELHLTAGGKP
jgi:choline dehydrogenase-like flavoprotein